MAVIRSIVASEDLASLVDRGAEVDSQIKNLTTEDKGIKYKINASAAANISEGESTIRLEGITAAAIVSAVESVSINQNAVGFDGVKRAVSNGIIDDVVARKFSVVIGQGDAKRAVDILNANGCPATLKEEFSTKAADLRAASEISGSAERAEALKALQGCVVKEVTYRVKYEAVAPRKG